MKLYFSKGACSLGVRITLHEIGLTCEFESVDLKTKKTEKGTDFLTINPKGAVPVLVLDNQEILTENTVIQQYLAEENKAVALLPPIGQFKRYRVLEWLSFVSSDLHKSCSMLFNPKIPDEVKEEILKPILKQKLNFVNNHLNNHSYLLDDYCIADSYLFVILSWLGKFKIDIASLPNLSRYFSSLKTRPSIQKALKEESLSF